MHPEIICVKMNDFHLIIMKLYRKICFYIIFFKIKMVAMETQISQNAQGLQAGTPQI